VAVATGSRWRRDGVGHLQNSRLQSSADAVILTPDDILSGTLPDNTVVVYDDDHYFMAASIALLLARAGRTVHYVSTYSLVAGYTQYTNEQRVLHTAVANECAAVRLLNGLHATTAGSVVMRDLYTGALNTLACDAVVLVTGRTPQDALWAAVRERATTVHRVGDALAPGTIAAAIHSGYLFGRELSTDVDVATAYARDSYE
jgi:dimethylamine/trimethylamine dehydrogenase